MTTKTGEQRAPRALSEADPRALEPRALSEAELDAVAGGLGFGIGGHRLLGLGGGVAGVHASWPPVNVA